VFIKVLYVVLVLCVGAVVGAVVAGYVRIRRHMNGSHSPAHEVPKAPEVKIEQEIRR